MTGKRDRVTSRTSERKVIRFAKHTSGRHGANELPFTIIENGGRAVAQRHTRRVKTATNKTYKGVSENIYKGRLERAKDAYRKCVEARDDVLRNPYLDYSDKMLLARKHDYYVANAGRDCNRLIDILNVRFGHKYKYVDY